MWKWGSWSLEKPATTPCRDAVPVGEHGVGDEPVPFDAGPGSGESSTPDELGVDQRLVHGGRRFDASAAAEHEIGDDSVEHIVGYQLLRPLMVLEGSEHAVSVAQGGQLQRYSPSHQRRLTTSLRHSKPKRRCATSLIRSTASSGESVSTSRSRSRGSMVFSSTMRSRMKSIMGCQ